MTHGGNKINSIQLLRAIAIILVVHAHAMDNQAGIFFQRKFFYLGNFGASGVDLFFVISGFIITVVAGRYATNRQGAYFFLKRFLRIIPLYWLVSFSVILIRYLHNGNLYNAASVINTIFIWPFFKSGTAELVLFQAWTLYFELLFYFVTSLAIIAGGRKYTGIVILFFSMLVALYHTIGGNITILAFCGNGIMIEFLLGVLVGLLFSSSFTMPAFVCNIIWYAGIAFFGATLLLGYGNISEASFTLNDTASLQRSLVWGTASMLVVGGLVMKEKNARLTIFPFWIAIGNASFSIYLVHVFITKSLYVIWQKWDLQSEVTPDIQVLISIVVVIAVGYLFYRLVEQPLLRKIHGFARSVRHRLSSKTVQQI